MAQMCADEACKVRGLSSRQQPGHTGSPQQGMHTHQPRPAGSRFAVPLPASFWCVRLTSTAAITRRQRPACTLPRWYATSTGPCSCCSTKQMNVASCCPSCPPGSTSPTRWSSLPRQLKVAFSSTSSAEATCHSRGSPGA